MRTRVWLIVLTFAAISALSLSLPASAGTTGGVTGRIVDSTTNLPLADVTVTAVSPSQAATTTTDSAGNYRFLSLPPDTYTLSFNKTAYTPVSDPGVTIQADHVQTVNVAMRPELRTIAQVRSRAATDIVRPGITSDVYSVDATAQRAAQNLTGPGGLNNAYGAIASVPGVALDPGEQGWFQTLHIRGGDFDQVGWELDGIPVNRVYDNAPQTMLSSLGQQELQVYTGGTPATADAQGLSGYVNQVIKTGTYPGFGALDAGIGAPAFYHQFSAEAGGSNPNRTFSYYIGLGGANQDFRYVDDNNGGEASNANWFFYPVNALQGTNGFVYTGCTAFPCGGTFIDPSLVFTTGSAFGIAHTAQRDSVVNVHFAIPHKKSSLRDDIQLLYLTSEIALSYYSSANDIGPAIAGCACAFGPLFWDDAFLYNGPMLQPADPASLAQYAFPSGPPHDFNNTLLPLDVRDSNSNGVGIAKLQYQHAFSANAFVRLYGYTLYSNWFIWGPNSAAQPFYGAELADYEIPNHTWGANISFTDQISSKHLLTASAVYTQTNLQRYYSSFFTSSRDVSLLMDANHNCIDPNLGTQVGCYFALANGAFDPVNGGGFYGSAGCITNGGCTGANSSFPGTTWVAVDRGLTGALNQVHPAFSGASITDQWRPNDRWTVNAGVRLEKFRFYMGQTQDPVRDQFWFPKYNAEYCFGQGFSAPVLRTGQGLGPCPTGTVPLAQSQFGALTDVSTGDYSTYRTQPRLGFTYTLDPETVLRGSFGVYARPQNSSWVQYNTPQENLASYIGSHFYAYGFNTPVHNIRPDTSYNYDISLEKRLHGTDWSLKLTPFYRSTQDQLQNFFIDPVSGLESGLNVGHQVSFGVEFAVRKGDFNNQGLSGQLSYTYTHSSIKYQNFPNSNRNVIDNLNSSIQDYNAYTSACAANPSNNPSNACFYPGFQPGGAPLLASGVAPSQCYSTAGAPAACGAGTVPNPYWNSAPQPLMDRAAAYPTYDVIPGPVSGENGYWTPDVASLIVNYRRGKFAITPSLNYNSGAEYGSPLAWPGYRPETCSATFTPPSGTAQADPASCTDLTTSSSLLLPVFIPDPFNGGKFDSLGTYKEPWRLSLNLNLSYDISPRVTADVLLTNIVDHCGQRGYAWDNSNVCLYAALPTGVLYPAGNFYPNSNLTSAPPQLKFPYSFWLNNNNTGFVGVKLPFQATFNLHFRL